MARHRHACGLLDESQFIATLERRQGLKVACPEEIAYRSGWVSAVQLEEMANPLIKNGYGQYLLQILKDGIFNEIYSPRLARCDLA